MTQMPTPPNRVPIMATKVLNAYKSAAAAGRPVGSPGVSFPSTPGAGPVALQGSPAQAQPAPDYGQLPAGLTARDERSGDDGRDKHRYRRGVRANWFNRGQHGWR